MLESQYAVVKHTILIDKVEDACPSSTQEPAVIAGIGSWWQWCGGPVALDARCAPGRFIKLYFLPSILRRKAMNVRKPSWTPLILFDR